MGTNLYLKAAGGNKAVSDGWVKTAGGNKRITNAWIKTAGGNKQFWPGFAVDTSAWTGYFTHHGESQTESVPSNAGIKFAFNNDETMVVELVDISGGLFDNVAWKDETGTVLTGDDGGRLTNVIVAMGLGPKYETFTDTWREAGVDNDTWVYATQTNSSSNTPNTFNSLGVWRQLNALTEYSVSVSTAIPDIVYLTTVISFWFAKSTGNPGAAPGGSPDGTWEVDLSAFTDDEPAPQ